MKLTFDKLFKISLLIILALYVLVLYLNNQSGNSKSRYRLMDNRFVFDTYTGKVRIIKIEE